MSRKRRKYAPWLATLAIGAFIFSASLVAQEAPAQAGAPIEAAAEGPATGAEAAQAPAAQVDAGRTAWMLTSTLDRVKRKILPCRFQFFKFF